MGAKCPNCNGDNGITHWEGKVCKYCGHLLCPKINNLKSRKQT